MKRVLWDITGMLFIFIQLLLIPLLICFEITLVGGFKIFNDVMDYYFITDLFVSFNTAYYESGILIKTRKKIAIHYLKFWFWIDLISSFPYDLMIEETLSSADREELQRNAQLLKFVRFLKFIKVIRLLRALKLKKIFGKLEEYLMVAQAINTFLQFMKLCIMILCIAHWCACIWYLVANTYGKKQNWVMDYGIEHKDWEFKYISSLYFSITTMTTVGYGDISATFFEEQIVAICMMILASGVFGYTMNSVVVILSEDNEDLISLRINSQVVMKYTKQKDLSLKLQNRIKSYIEWLQENQALNNGGNQKVITQLSATLRQEIVFLINGRIIKKMPILKTRFSAHVLTNTAFLLEEQCYVTGEYVFEEHHEDPNHYLYYLRQGQILLEVQTCRVSVKLLEDEATFGVVRFFANLPRSLSAKSLHFSQVMKVSRHSFLKLLTNHDLEEFHQVKYQLEIEGQYQKLLLKCYGCGSFDHIIKHCPLMHYTIHKSDVHRVIQHAHKQLNENVKARRSKRQKVHFTTQITDYSYLRALQRINTDIVRNELRSGLKRFKLDKSITLQDSKNDIKESFNIEQAKRFRKFCPKNNLDLMIQQPNCQANELIDQLKQKKKRHFLEIMRKKKFLKNKFKSRLDGLQQRDHHVYQCKVKVCELKEEEKEMDEGNVQKIRSINTCHGSHQASRRKVQSKSLDLKGGTLNKNLFFQQSKGCLIGQCRLYQNKSIVLF